ncbi:MAG TPA: hypothetical protein VGB77_05350 [Abditibacteriaceae bacterium]
MIGFVSPQGRPILRLVISGTNTQEIECWLDTGFDGGLLLNQETVASLGLEAGSTVTALLADGSAIEAQSYRAEVQWNEEAKRVQVVQAEGLPLIGLTLLRDHEIRIHLIPGGTVGIEPID